MLGVILLSSWNVKVKDFQSLKAVDIDIEPGITIITGPTNNGKTAILRAIENSLFNSMSDDMVRSGKKIAGVTISNGTHSMVYMRNAKSSSEKTAYQFDGGAVQKKVGRSQLPEVVDMFGVTDVKLNNGIKVRLNFWEQNDKPFLMDKTAGQLFEFLSLSSADKYYKVLKQISGDIKVQNSEIDSSNTVIDTLKSINNSKKDFIEKNQGFDDVYAKVITLGQDVDKLNKCMSDVDLITGILDKKNKVKSCLKDVNTKLGHIPLESISDMYEKMVLAKEEYDRLYSDAVILAGIKKSISSLESTISGIDDKYNSFTDVIGKTASKVSSLTSFDSAVKDTESRVKDCIRLLKAIEEVKSKIGNIKVNDLDFNQVYQDIDNAKNLKSEIENLTDTISKLDSTGQMVSKVSHKLSGLDTDIQSVSEELETLKQDVGYCPFCGSVFDKGCSHE